MQLNGARLNGSLLNGAVTSLLVLATATWSAEATVTSAPICIASGSAAWTHNANVLFSSDKTIFGWASLASSSDFVVLPNSIYAASCGWGASSTFNSYTIRIVNAYAGFDSLSELYALANSKLAHADWLADASFVSVAHLDLRPLASVSATASQYIAEGLVTRYVTSSLIGSADAWIEPTVTHNGVTYHDGYSNIRGGSSLSVDSSKTTLFINASLGTCYSYLDGTSRLIHAAKSELSTDSIFSALPTKVSYASAGIESSSIVDFGLQSFLKPASSALSANTTLSVKADVIHASSVAMVATSTASYSPIATRYVSTNITAGCAQLTIIPSDNPKGLVFISSSSTALFEGGVTTTGGLDISAGASIAMSAGTIKAASAAWLATEFSAMSADAYSIVPAPDSRRLFIPSDIRSFEVPVQVRKFEVAA